MNFVLHAYLAQRDLGSPADGAAAALPDLWRIAHRRAHLRSLPAGAAAPLRAGLAHHTAADAWFHGSASLRRGEQALRDALAAAALSAPKLGLFAHPLWEMCLDGALVRRQGAGAAKGLLRAAFEQADRDRREAEGRFAAAIGVDPPAFAARMERIVDEAARGPWLDAYAHGEGLAVCLDGIRLRAGLPRLLPDERPRLGALLDSLAAEADRGLDEVLAAAPFGVA